MNDFLGLVVPLPVLPPFFCEPYAVDACVLAERYVAAIEAGAKDRGKVVFADKVHAFPLHDAELRLRPGRLFFKPSALFLVYPSARAAMIVDDLIARVPATVLDR